MWILEYETYHKFRNKVFRFLKEDCDALYNSLFELNHVTDVLKPVEILTEEIAKDGVE